MSSFLDHSLIIQKAAALARGDRFSKLQAICDSQQSISTRSLRILLEEVMRKERQDALHFRALAEFVREHNKGQI